jgi:hypothetical protein
MAQSGTGKYELDCPLAHNLINKLSVIVGTCDLLVEKAPEDSPVRPQMLLIQNVARSMAADLGQFQCDLVRLRTRTKN